MAKKTSDQNQTNSNKTDTTGQEGSAVTSKSPANKPKVTTAKKAGKTAPKPNKSKRRKPQSPAKPATPSAQPAEADKSEAKPTTAPSTAASVDNASVSKPETTMAKKTVKTAPKPKVSKRRKPQIQTQPAPPSGKPAVVIKSEAKPTTALDTQESSPVYLESELPLSMSPPLVEQAESIKPPIPETAEPIEESEANVSTTPKTPEPEPDPQEPEPEQHFHVEHPGPQHRSKFIVQITPELAPLAKVGGLADVVTGLSRELEVRGNTVEIILPKYDCMRYDHVWGLCETFHDLWVPWYGGHINCTVWFGFVHERKCFFIEPHSPDNFFNRGSIYGFDDDILRFAFFSRAALEFLLKSGKQPDVIHCHDWQTALVPVFLYEIYQHIGMTHPRVCFTIHNFKHQGVTGDFLLNATGLYRPEYYFHHDRLLDNHIPHALNLMKGGVVYSNFVTTVSPRYAGETKDGGQGFGLEPTLHQHHYKYGGVVNGIDYDAWNPEIDEHIPVQYGINNIDAKYVNKQALRQRLMLADNNKPIIAFIGRLDPQKGLDLVRHALFYAINNAAQFILLGSSPDQDINNYFWELKRHLNDCQDCHIEVGFDEELAHLIYAGSDMMVVPSLFEPCGLTQLISMQYGTIPVVRAVGGLADTVHDKDHAHDRPLHERNGFVFTNYDNAGIESALSRAIGCYYQYPEHFRDLIANAMRSDYSWHIPGQHYLNIYDYISN